MATEMGQGQCCTTNTWCTSMSDANYCFQSPDDRCCAISYVRLLLGDSMLKAHQHGLHVTRECECGQGIEDTYHFLHEYTIHHMSIYVRHSLMKWRTFDKTVPMKAYTVGSALPCAVFWISINHSTVSSDCIGNLRVH